MRAGRGAICGLAAALGLMLVGCRALAALGVLVTPPKMQKAEVELTAGGLAIVTDYARPGQVNPVFDSTLHRRIEELLRDNKVASRVVPYDEVVRLQQANPDFGTWSVQRVGRELGAEQVLHLRIDDLRLRETPGDPVVTPSVELHAKVVAAGESATQARAWPDRKAEPEGRRVNHSRPAHEADTRDAIDAETAKLAREAAYLVARHFYEYDTEDSLPREP